MSKPLLPERPMEHPYELFQCHSDHLTPEIHYESAAFGLVRETQEYLFTRELQKLINKYYFENCGNIPDYIGAEFMLNAYKAFAQSVKSRDQYFGEDHSNKQRR